eukprot:ctg_166.g102
MLITAGERLEGCTWRCMAAAGRPEGVFLAAAARATGAGAAGIGHFEASAGVADLGGVCGALDREPSGVPYEPGADASVHVLLVAVRDVHVAVALGAVPPGGVRGDRFAGGDHLCAGYVRSGDAAGRAAECAEPVGTGVYCHGVVLSARSAIFDAAGVGAAAGGARRGDLHLPADRIAAGARNRRLAHMGHVGGVQPVVRLCGDRLGAQRAGVQAQRHRTRSVHREHVLQSDAAGGYDCCLAVVDGAGAAHGPQLQLARVFGRSAERFHRQNRYLHALVGHSVCGLQPRLQHHRLAPAQDRLGAGRHGGVDGGGAADDVGVLSAAADSGTQSLLAGGGAGPGGVTVGHMDV